MIYLMIFTMFFLLIVSYYATGKDLIAPSNVMLMTFFLALISALYNLSTWKFNLGLYSSLLIIFSLMITVIINGYVHQYYSRRNVKIKKENLHAIRLYILIIFVGYLIMCVILQYRVIRSIGKGSLSTLMYIYRLSTSYGTGTIEVKAISSKMIDVATAITYICLFNMILFFRSTSLVYKVINILEIILWVFLYFLQGARFEVFSVCISAFIMFWFLRIRETKIIKKFNIKQVLKIMIIAIVLLYLFYILKNFVGRSSDKTIVEYLTSYLGGGIPCFDLFIKDPPVKSNVFGQETFYSLIEGLKRRGIINAPAVSFHKEFRTSNNVGIGNVYTALRDYYYDFGVLGMFIMHSIFSVFFSYLYEKTKIKMSYIKIIFLSILYNRMVFYMFNNMFFSSDCSISFCFKAIFIILLFNILMKREIWGRKIKI